MRKLQRPRAVRSTVAIIFRKRMMKNISVVEASRCIGGMRTVVPRYVQFPPTFVVALGTEMPQIPEALEYGKGWLNGGDRFEYLEPIRIGDEIRTRTVLTDVYEKQGGSGGLLFLIFDTEYVNQHDRVAVRVRGTRIRR